MFTQNKHMVYLSCQHPCTYLRKTILYNISKELNASLCSDLISFHSIKSPWDSACKNNARWRSIWAPSLYVGTVILQFAGSTSVFSCVFILSTQKLSWHFLTHSMLMDTRRVEPLPFPKCRQRKITVIYRKSFHSLSAKADRNYYPQTLPQECIFNFPSQVALQKKYFFAYGSDKEIPAWWCSLGEKSSSFCGADTILLNDFELLWGGASWGWLKCM